MKRRYKINWITVSAIAINIIGWLLIVGLAKLMF